MTDLVALSTKIDDLSDDIGDMSQDTSDLFAAVTTLKNGVQGQIDAAIVNADENVIIPVMAMYTNQVLMATSIANLNNIYITLITPEA
jgi:hypothetical protein